jgi:hypothetical protein
MNSDVRLNIAPSVDAVPLLLGSPKRKLRENASSR